MDEINAAQQLLESIGVAIQVGTKQAHGAKTASATKSGPGRYDQHGKRGARISKERPVRAYRALMNAWAAKRVTKAALRDEHGAYTLVGACVERTGRGLSPTSREHLMGGIISGRDAPVESCFRVRRIWLAGISAQRGY